MAVTVHPASPTTPIHPPDIRTIVAPILAVLPGAAVSTHPAPAILPVLSPILRQRVQLLSASSAGNTNEPWIRLLTYEPARVPRLAEIAQSGGLEPHPASGEIEVDWDRDVLARFRRLDRETLQTFVLLREFGLFVRLVYCTGDKEGGDGGDGWRVGEVGAADAGLASLTAFGGFLTLVEAERSFAQQEMSSSGVINRTNGIPVPEIAEENIMDAEAGADEEEDDDDDDDYWARYDATPARTPAVKRSPAPPSIGATATTAAGAAAAAAAEDDYYAQYDSVQPAMDNHDPEEEAELQTQNITAPPLGLASAEMTTGSGDLDGAWTLAEAPPRSPHDKPADEDLAHPRPESSASSNGERTVARLEETAERRDQAEFGIRQHVSRSIRSLFMLSRASGIDREEFDAMVRAELDVLDLVDGET